METLEQYASSAREESGEIIDSPVDGPAELLMASERRQLLLQALDHLAEDAQEVVKLRFFERLSAREIAEIIDSTEGAVRTKLHRILRVLRAQCSHIKENA